MSTDRGNRYSAAMMLRARQLREAGWTYKAIRGLLLREFGLAPSWKTVERWCIPDELADRRRAYQARHRARSRAEEHRPRVNVTDEWKLARMRELHGRDVSPRAIGQVAAVFWGEELSDDQVRGRLAGRRGYRKRAVA